MFIVKFAGREVRVETVIVPRMVMTGDEFDYPGVVIWDEAGDGEPVITGSESWDRFIREHMCYHVNEGQGYEVRATGSLDQECAETFGGSYAIEWEYVPDYPKGE